MYVFFQLKNESTVVLMLCISLRLVGKNNYSIVSFQTKNEFPKKGICK